MKISDDLTALIFELQRARSPADKAKALARAWRTLRGLSNAERRLLVREVGFDGAEDLVEGLAGKSGGLFAPAAVLEALGRMRKEEDLTVRGILADFKDPERREDLFIRGIDLVAEGRDDDETDEPEFASDATVEDEEEWTDPPLSVIVDSEIVPDEATDRVAEEPVAVVEPPKPVAAMPPPPPARTEEVPDETRRAVEDDVGVDLGPHPEPVVAVEDPSTWDEQWAAAPSAGTARNGGDRSFAAPVSGDWVVVNSVFRRLQAFRQGMEELRGAAVGAVIETLDGLPEPWAKRRAVVALLEAEIPANTEEALDLVESLERPMDRKWCLSALARRGDLAGENLERAVQMLQSPAARRRVRALAGA